MYHHNNSHKSSVCGSVLGVAALSALAYYLFATPNGKRKKDILKHWMLQMKGEVMNRLSKLKEIKKNEYYSLIDEIKKRYESLKEIESRELADFADELKSMWHEARKEIKNNEQDNRNRMM